jgi:5-methylcytosine-specific restriction protein B
VEHGTKDYIRLGLGNASAHEIVRAKNGSWRIGKAEGYSEAEARAHYATSVLPRLQELLGAARAYVEQGAPAPFTSPKLGTFRTIDAKTFCLFVAVLDRAVAKRRLVGVLSKERLQTLSRLLDVAWSGISTFADYFETQVRLGTTIEQLARTGGLDAYALGRWSYWDARGKLLAGLIEGNIETENGEDEDESDENENENEAKPSVVDNGEVTPISRRHPAEPPTPSWDTFLRDLDPDLAPTARLLRSRYNVVLYGPPGTGKTYTATQLARAWAAWQGDVTASEPTIEQVTFHPSYGYEDFIEAFRPSESDGARFVLRNGILPVLAARAHENPGRSYLLVIDELNRGDVARILGELITLLEADKRGPEHARRRMLSSKPLWLPRNLYVVGTMNTADKSVSLMDVAVRRRFAFVPTPPRPDLLHARRGLVEKAATVKLSDILNALNRRLLAIGVLPDRLLGHALLWIEQDDVDDEVVAVAERFRFDILPLVEEYCFCDRAQMRQVVGKLVDEHGRPADAVLDSHEAFVKALEALVSSDDAG